MFIICYCWGYIISKIRIRCWSRKISTTAVISHCLMSSAERRYSIIIIKKNICPICSIVWSLYTPNIWVSIRNIVTRSNSKMRKNICLRKLNINPNWCSTTAPFCITHIDFIVKDIISSLTSPIILFTCYNWGPIPISVRSINPIIFWICKISSNQFVVGAWSRP